MHTVRTTRPPPFAWAAMAVVGAVPLWPAPGLSHHDLQRTLECLVLLGASATLCWQAHGVPRAAARQGLLFGGLLVLVLISCWSSEHPAAALQESSLWLGLLGWGFVCRGQALAGAERPLLRAMAGGMTAYTAVVMALYVLALTFNAPLDARSFIIGFDNPRFLNHVQTVAIPLLWVVAASDSNRRWQAAALFAAVGQIALTALTLARATFLAWLVVLVVLTVLRARRISRFGWGCLAAGLCCAAVLFVAVPEVMNRAWRPSFARPSELNAAHSRDLLWEAALTQSLASPWLGQGPMHFAAKVNPTAAHPHNVYLQLASEIGLPAALLLLGLLLRPLKQGLQRLRSVGDSQPLLAGAAAAVLAALVDGAFSGNFVMPLSQLWIAAAWGLLAGAAARREPGFVEVRPGDTRRLAVLLMLTQLALCAAVAIQVPRDPPRIRIDSPIPAPGETFRPRFWLDGWL